MSCVGYGVFPSRLGVKGCFSDLFMECSGSITFDSRGGVSLLTQVFELVIVCLLQRNEGQVVVEPEGLLEDFFRVCN